MFRSTTVRWFLLCLGILAACKEDGAAAASPTRVSVLTAQIVDFAPATTPVLLKPGARVLVARGHPEHATEAVLPERALPGIY